MENFKDTLDKLNAVAPYLRPTAPANPLARALAATYRRRAHDQDIALG